MAKNEKLALYNRVREVPDDAKKVIEAGRLKGKTDINPLWRIQTLTKEFGPAGVGWYTKIVEKQIESVGDEQIIFLHINLFYKTEDGWSMPVEGFGGAMIAEKEKGGIHPDDDAFKKAYTDAISQACRSLGIGADVYWANDATKYQQEKVMEEVIEYMKTITSAKEMDKLWNEYAPYYGNDKTFKTEYTKRYQEIVNGISK